MGYYEKIQSRKGRIHFSRKGGEPARTFNPTYADVAAIRAIGKLTFSSLRGGFFRCNQRGELGKLTEANKALLRERVGALNTNRPADVPVPAPPQIPTLRISRSGPTTECPFCKEWIFVRRDTTSCIHCKGIFKTE